MKNFLLGIGVGFGLGAMLGTVGVVVAQQPGNPYSEGSFQRDQFLYNQMLDRGTDQYLLEQKLHEQGYRSPCP